MSLDSLSKTNSSHVFQYIQQVPLSIATIMIMVEMAAKELQKIYTEMRQTYQAAATVAAVAVYHTQVDAAQKKYEAEKLQAAVGITAGVASGIGGFVGLGTGLPPISSAVDGFAKVIDKSGDIPAAQKKLDAEQDNALAEYMSKLINQNQSQSDSAHNDAKQILQDLLKFVEAMAELLGRMNAAVRMN